MSSEENDVTEKQRQDWQTRIEALGLACRHRFSGETAEDVVKNAKIYLAFLRQEPDG